MGRATVGVMTDIPFVAHVTHDAALLRRAATRDLSAPVPACPDWTCAELLGHVAIVYLHKTVAMQTGARPDPWPPADLDRSDPVAFFDSSQAALLAEFAGRRPADAAWTFVAADQSVGFWQRRMAHETVVHRVDAEQASGGAVSKIDADLALDGIDEFLDVFVSGPWWADEPTDAGAGTTLAVSSGGRSWAVDFAREAASLRDAAEAADVTVAGDPAAVDLWLWGREAPGVTVTGDPAGVRARLDEAAQ